MMRLIAVGCNRVVLSAVVTGGLPQLCPSEIGERLRRARFEHVAHPQATGSSMQPIKISSGRVYARTSAMSGFGEGASRIEEPLRVARGDACYAA
jgi:hypothetical protein